MATVGRIDVDAVEEDDSLAAARGGDLAARWRALEACRQYLRLVVGKNRWPGAADEPATSDLVQDTILEGLARLRPVQGEHSGTASRVASGHARPQLDQGTAAATALLGWDPAAVAQRSPARSRRRAWSSSEMTRMRQSRKRSVPCRSIISRSSSGGSGTTFRSQRSARGSACPTIRPRSSTRARSPGCVN